MHDSGRRILATASIPTAGPLDPFSWAAIRIMLPVLCILNIVAVEVLPRTERPLTLPGLTRENLCLMLLIKTRGEEVLLASELSLCIKTEVVLLFGRLSARIAEIFGTVFVNIPSTSVMGVPSNLPALTDDKVLANAVPARALQVIIMILLSDRELLPRAMPIASPPFIVTLRPRQLTNENINTVPLLGIITAHLLPTLATVLTEAFPISIPVLTILTRAPLITPFATPTLPRVIVGTES